MRWMTYQPRFKKDDTVISVGGGKIFKIRDATVVPDEEDDLSYVVRAWQTSKRLWSPAFLVDMEVVDACFEPYQMGGRVIEL